MKRLSLPVSSLVCYSLVCAGACSQAPAAAPPAPPSTALVSSVKIGQDFIKDVVVKTAAQVPDKLLSFQPTKEVRTLGQILGHIADSNYFFCGLVSSEKKPDGSAEKSAVTKADLQKALADSYAYCDRTYAALNDQTGAAELTVADMGNMKTTKLGLLSFSAGHNSEHYGNLVTYMRLNKIVPPSSQ